MERGYLPDSGRLVVEGFDDIGLELGLELLLFEASDNLEPIFDLEYHPSLYLIIIGVPGSVISYP